MQAVMRRAGQVQRLQADITPDPMIDVHDQIAGIERSRVGDEVRGLSLAPRPGQTVPKNIGFGDHRDFGRLESRLQRNFNHSEIGLLRRFHRMHQRQIGQAVIGHDIDEAIGRAHGPGREDNRAAIRLEPFGMRDGSFEYVDVGVQAFRRKIPPCTSFQVERFGTRLSRVETRGRARCKPRFQFPRCQVKRVRRQHLGLAHIAFPGLKPGGVVVFRL